jgi:hypothetical protein
MPKQSKQTRAVREKAAEGLFWKYVNALVKRFGNGPLSSDDIDSYGHEAFGARYGGVDDQHIKLKPGKLYVVNTSFSPKSPGVHWVAVAVSKAGVVHLYDSFARNGSALMPKLRANVQKTGSGRHFSESDRTDAEQVDGALCGHMSLSWLSVVRDLGVRDALLI